MTREQIMERQPICEGLMALYQQATGNKIEVFYNSFVVYVGNGMWYDTAKRFVTGAELMEFILTELHNYLLESEA